MKISVVSIREYSRLNERLGRTSDGWFYGDKTIHKCQVFIEKEELSFHDAFIINRFVEDFFYEEHDCRTDGPDDPIVDINYNENETNKLIRLLDSKTYVASSSYGQLKNAMPKVLEICDKEKLNKSDFKQNRDSAFIHFINSLLDSEIKYLVPILQNIVNPNERIEILAPEKYKVIELISKWHQEQLSFENKNETDKNYSEFYLTNLFRKINFGYINSTPHYYWTSLKIKNIKKQILSIFLHEEKWSGFPIDLAIYVNDIEILNELLKKGGTSYLDYEGLYNITIKYKDAYTFKHQVFPLENMISSELSSILVDIIRNDFLEGLKIIFSKVNDFKKLLAISFCISAECKSFDIFEYVLNFLDSTSIISINSQNHERDFNFKEKNKISESVDSIVRAYKKSNIESFKTISMDEKPRDYVEYYSSVVYYTPLQFVCRYGTIEMIKMIIEKTVDINFVNHGHTALDIFLKNRPIELEAQKETYDFLIKNGATKSNG